MRKLASKIFSILFMCFAASQLFADATKEKLLNKYVFDINYYMQANPDVTAALNGDQDAIRDHWVNTGFYEGRRGSLVFRAGNYECYNPDLAKIYGDFLESYLSHFLAVGINEGRVSSFYYYGRYYVSKYLDLQSVFGANNYTSALNHFMQSGIYEGRQASPWFSATEYEKANPDIAAAFGVNYLQASLNYFITGRNESRPLGAVTDTPDCSPSYNVLSGSWRSPQSPGNRYSVTQSGRLLSVCFSGNTCGRGGVSGALNVKHSGVLIGDLIDYYGPRMQWTIKMDSPSHGTIHVDSCRAISSSISCDVKAGDVLEVIKE